MLKSVGCIILSTLICISFLELAFNATYLNFAISRTLGTPVKTSAVVTLKYKIKYFIENDLFKPDSSSGTHSSDIDEPDEEESKEQEQEQQRKKMENKSS